MRGSGNDARARIRGKGTGRRARQVTTRDVPFYITDISQIRVLASATRQDIVDAVGVIGPCTMTELATFLGRRADSLYYHVSVLEEVGLLVVAENIRNAQGREVPLFDVPGRPVFLRYDPGNRRNVEAVSRFAATTLRSASRSFGRALAGGDVTVEGPLRDLWTARWKGWLTRRDLAEVNALLSRLIELLRRGSGSSAEDAELCELTFVLAPVRTKPGRRSRPPRGREAPKS